jgi:hypothetical protein
VYTKVLLVVILSDIEKIIVKASSIILEVIVLERCESQNIVGRRLIFRAAPGEFDLI